MSNVEQLRAQASRVEKARRTLVEELERHGEALEVLESVQNAIEELAVEEERWNALYRRYLEERSLK
ncbi:MAG: hypothetical protein IPJ34_22310 [Myxococcales bacterium]|nr:hypothetical protein [Myxococcales bacterium]